MYRTTVTLHRVSVQTTCSAKDFLLTITRREETSTDGISSRPQDNCLVGLCTGLLAATAITSAPSLSLLVPIGVEMVIVAFRIGVYVGGMAEQLDAVNTTDSWTYVVPDTTEESATSILAAFRISQVGDLLLSHTVIG